MPDNRYKLIRRTPEEAYGTISATPEFTYPESIVPETSILDTLYEDAKRLPDQVREGLKQHLAAIGAPQWTGPAPRDTLLPGTAPDDMETLSQLLGSVHTGGPKFGLGLIRIPGKDLTIGDVNFKNQLSDMQAGHVPYKSGIGGAGFSGHQLLYDEKPPITVPVPRTADIPLDVFSGLDPQRFQTHVDKGGQRFIAGALRGPAPPVRYTRGTSVHYKLPGEFSQSHHPVAHATSEELDVINRSSPSPPGFPPMPRKSSVTPSALEVVSEVQPETNVSQQGLQIKPPVTPTTSTALSTRVSPYSPRIANGSPELLDHVGYGFDRMVDNDPRTIALLDDLQDAIESGRLGGVDEVGTPAWRISMHQDPGFLTTRPYNWNGLSMKNYLQEKYNLNVARDPTDPVVMENLLRKFAEKEGITLRDIDEVKPITPTAEPPKVRSATEYDQIRLGEAMYNAARQDIKRRGNIPLFGRSGWSYTRGGGGSPFTAPDGTVRPSPGTIDMYENIPKKMGMVPDVVRMESLPGSQFEGNLREWARYLEPGRNNAIGKHMLEQGTYIEALGPHGGYTTDLPVWVHPEELEQLKRLGWWTPEKGRGEELLSQVADAERYNEWGNKYAPHAIDPRIKEVVEKLNKAAANPETFLKEIEPLRSGDYSDLLSNTGGNIRFNMTPEERMRVREFLAKSEPYDPPFPLSPTENNLWPQLSAYGSVYAKNTIEDLAKALRHGESWSSREILQQMVKDNPMMRKPRSLIETLITPGAASKFGTPAFRMELARQLAQGKYKDIVEPLTSLVGREGGNAFSYLESPYPLTVKSIRSNPDFPLSLTPDAQDALRIRELVRSKNHYMYSIPRAIEDVMPGEGTIQNYLERAMRFSYPDKEQLMEMGRHPQRIKNVLKKYGSLSEGLRAIETRQGASTWLENLYDYIKNYKRGARIKGGD